MFNITVPLEIWITSQVFALACVVFTVVAYQVKRKATTLLVWGIGFAFMGVALALLQSWTPFALVACGVVRNLIFWRIELRREQGKEIKRQYTLAIILTFMMISVIAVVFTWEIWVDWVLLGCSLFISLGNWVQNIHLFRIANAFYDCFVVITYVATVNIIGIAHSVILVGAVVVFYVRLGWKKRGEKSIDSF